MGLLILPLLRTLAWISYLQPAFLREAWLGGVAAILRVTGFRERVVLQNLDYAFPGAEAEPRKAGLARENYRHFARLALEILYLFGPMRSFCLSRARLSGKAHWDAAKARGKGVIFLASHVGNWEVMAARGALSGIEIMLVTKHLKPEWLHQAIEAGRATCGVRGTYEPRTLKDVLGELKRGGTVGFVLDQYAGPPVGVRVPFFGVPVGTATIIATLARRTGATVLPVFNHRNTDGTFDVDIQPPAPWIVDPNPTRELALNTAAYSRVIEKHILEFPEQWLWIHRRFKGDLSPLRADEWDAGRARS